MDLILYRGDCIYNALTQPGKYRGDGLRSKSFNGDDDPLYINRNGWIDSMKTHINPVGPTEWDRYNKTSYLSFSEDKQRAMDWARGSGSLIVPCDNDYYETHYVFTMVIPRSELVQLDNARYLFTYACNQSLLQANSPDPHGIVTYALRYAICEVCGGVERNHSVIVIDNIRALEKVRHVESYRTAFNNAVKDKEWLILPNDPLDHIRSGRIRRANFWSAEHYVVPNEAARDPLYAK